MKQFFRDLMFITGIIFGMLAIASQFYTLSINFSLIMNYFYIFLIVFIVSSLLYLVFAILESRKKHENN